MSVPTSKVRPAGTDDVAAVLRLEEECLGVDAWSEALVRDGDPEGAVREMTGVTA